MDQGFTANLNFVSQTGIPHESYTLLRFTHVPYNTFPTGSIIATSTDFAFVAPYVGIVRFSGQMQDVIDPSKPMPSNPSYVVKIFKTVAGIEGDVFAGMGGPGAFWWANEVQVQGEDMTAVGDIYRWRIYASAGVGNTSYVDGNPAHTRIHVSMSSP